MAKKSSTTVPAFAVEAAPEGLPKRQYTPSARSLTPNPFEDHVRAVADDGQSYKVPVENDEQGKEAERLLRQAGNRTGLSVRLRNQGDGVVYFTVSTAKARVRRYTDAEVKEWHGLPADAKLTKEQRAEYRTALDAAEAAQSE